jgi:FkbM family methyltransferase
MERAQPSEQADHEAPDGEPEQPLRTWGPRLWPMIDAHTCREISRWANQQRARERSAPAIRWDAEQPEGAPAFDAGRHEVRLHPVDFGVLHRWVADHFTSQPHFGRLSHDQRGVPVIPLLELVYGTTDEDLLRHAMQGGTDRITELAQLRAIVLGLDRQQHPTSIEIRFGADDVEWVQLEDLVLAVDRADTAVSAPIMAGSWEPHTTRLFKRFVRPGMTVADVGANVGYFTMLAAALVGSAGRVYAFDPNPENCRLIALSINRSAIDTIHLLPVALGASNGYAYFTSAIGSNGGILGDDPSFLLDGRGSVVPMLRLDALLDDDHLDLLKVDVEGAEHLVVQGALSIVERARPVIISEFSCEMISRVSGVRPAEYLASLTNRGYRIFVIERSGELRDVDSPENLVRAWPHPAHIEDLLLLPSERV